MDFQPINTQEELNKVISDRLKRERETVTKEFQTQVTERDAKIAERDTKIAELTKSSEELGKQIEDLKTANKEIDGLKAKVTQYEKESVKMRVANELGLPLEMASRLTGDDEDAIRKDAETVKKLIKPNRSAPLRSTEDDSPDAATAWGTVFRSMKGE